MTHIYSLNLMLFFIAYKTKTNMKKQIVVNVCKYICRQHLGGCSWSLQYAYGYYVYAIVSAASSLQCDMVG